MPESSFNPFRVLGALYLVFVGIVGAAVVGDYWEGLPRVLPTDRAALRRCADESGVTLPPSFRLEPVTHDLEYPELFLKFAASSEAPPTVKGVRPEVLPDQPPDPRHEEWPDSLTHYWKGMAFTDARLYGWEEGGWRCELRVARGGGLYRWLYKATRDPLPPGVR